MIVSQIVDHESTREKNRGANFPQMFELPPPSCDLFGMVVFCDLWKSVVGDQFPPLLVIKRLSHDWKKLGDGF